MNTQVDKPVEAPVDSNNNSLDFELWASLVKRQLLAALQKRTTKL